MFILTQAFLSEGVKSAGNSSPPSRIIRKWRHFPPPLIEGLFSSTVHFFFHIALLVIWAPLCGEKKNGYAHDYHSFNEIRRRRRRRRPLCHCPVTLFLLTTGGFQRSTASDLCSASSLSFFCSGTRF